MSDEVSRNYRAMDDEEDRRSAKVKLSPKLNKAISEYGKVVGDTLKAVQNAAVVAELRRVRRWLSVQHTHATILNGASVGYCKTKKYLTRRIERLNKKGRKK